MEKALENNLEPLGTEKPEPCPEINATPDAAQEQNQDHASPVVDEQQPAENEQQPVMDVQPTSENQDSEPEKLETKASPSKRSNRNKVQKRTKSTGPAKDDDAVSTPPQTPASGIWTFGMQAPAEEPKPLSATAPMDPLGAQLMEPRSAPIMEPFGDQAMEPFRDHLMEPGQP